MIPPISEAGTSNPVAQPNEALENPSTQDIMEDIPVSTDATRSRFKDQLNSQETKYKSSLTTAALRSDNFGWLYPNIDHSLNDIDNKSIQDLESILWSAKKSKEQAEQNWRPQQARWDSMKWYEQAANCIPYGIALLMYNSTIDGHDRVINALEAKLSQKKNGL